MTVAKDATGKLDGWKQTALTFWGERNRRERAMLLGAIAVIMLGLFYALLIDPAVSGRKDLEKKLPVLRQQVAEMQAMASDTSALTAKVGAPASVLTRESLEASLVKRGLKPESVTFIGELAKIKLASASFADLIDWLDEMQRTAQLSVVDANIDALAQTGMVSAAFTLRQQKSERTQ